MKPLIYNDLPLDLKNIINTEYDRLLAFFTSYDPWKNKHMIFPWTNFFVKGHYVNATASFPTPKPITDYPDITKVYFDPETFPQSRTTLTQIIVFKSLMDHVEEPPYSQSPNNLTQEYILQGLIHRTTKLKLKNVTSGTTTGKDNHYFLTLPVYIIRRPPEVIKPWKFLAYADKPWTESKLYPNQITAGWESLEPAIKGKYVHKFLFAEYIDRFNNVTAKYPKILHYQPKIAAKLLLHYIECDYKAYSTNLTLNIQIDKIVTDITITEFIRLLLMQGLLTTYKPIRGKINLPTVFNRLYCTQNEPLIPIPLSSLSPIFKNLEPTFKELIT